MRPSRTSILASRPGSLGRRSQGQRGFTLIELMVTVAVAAILATIAVPSYNEAMLGTKLNTLANNFVASAQLARSEAIKRNATVRLCAGSSTSGCTGGAWGNGWIVRVPGGAVIYTQPAVPNGFLLSGNVSIIDFRSTGVGATAANLTLCRATPSVGTQQRVITVSATGRPRVERV